ncbi:cupin domain-containing protein [Sphingosinicella sp. CPCC 101087]|uniref:cupin domain-containing protein n=1 Tax=Sphingosinicella sp. CPCC 101087 TaxID=2497754 RepID=UPI00101C756B|nr:cupin domain-containing protein [Sphingosinicella sp. CPCC 101087]
MPQLATHPIHLGLGATAVVEPPLGGMEWFAAYGERHAGDGAEGRLVTQYSFSESWTTWEVHPNGAEVVLCIAGRATLIQQFPGGEEARVTLGPGDYAVNPAGVWHTADVEPGVEATCIFITAGQGTDHRPR